MRKLTMATAALSLVLCGCALIHSETRPDLALPDGWRDAPAIARDDIEAVLARDFWLGYGDSALNALMTEALRANPEVRIAAANVEAYRARVAAARADRMPQLGLGAQVARGKGGDYPPAATDVFNVGATLSWEIDLWGRLARASDAARADLLAQREVQRGVYLSLASSVVQAYFTLRQLDSQLEISRQTLTLRRQSLDLFRMRFDGGVISEVELAQVQSEFEQAAAAVPQLEASIARAENALSVLVGRNPAPIERGRRLADIQDLDVPAGLPSQLLARRPDIRSAEAQLAAADARVDAARLAWFPRISLTGLFGGASTDLSALFNQGNQVWYGVGGLTQPIFDAGRIGSGVDSAKAQRAMVLAQYQKTVQGAFREVNDALAGRVKLREQVAASERQVAALRRYAELAHLRYENGYTSYLEVIDAERALFAADLSLISTRAALLETTVDLFRALGGRWIDQHLNQPGQRE